MSADDPIDPLFDMWLRFRTAFANRAIDELDISEDAAEIAARNMDAVGPAGQAFGYLLRYISIERTHRKVMHMVDAIDAAAEAVGCLKESLSYEDIRERYEALKKGDA